MKKYLVASSLLGFVNLAIASTPILDNPQSCPSVSSIKEIVLIEKILPLPSGSWVSIFEPRKYNTEDRWIFALSNFSADTKEQAYEKTIQGLKSLYFVSGPTLDESSITWTCDYRTAEGYYGKVTKQTF